LYWLNVWGNEYALVVLLPRSNGFMISIVLLLNGRSTVGVFLFSATISIVGEARWGNRAVTFSGFLCRLLLIPLSVLKNGVLRLGYGLLVNGGVIILFMVFNRPLISVKKPSNSPSRLNSQRQTAASCKNRIALV
jgi:hypothetical protein